MTHYTTSFPFGFLRNALPTISDGATTARFLTTTFYTLVRLLPRERERDAMMKDRCSSLPSFLRSFRSCLRPRLPVLRWSRGTMLARLTFRKGGTVTSWKLTRPFPTYLPTISPRPDRTMVPAQPTYPNSCPASIAQRARWPRQRLQHRALATLPTREGTLYTG